MPSHIDDAAREKSVMMSREHHKPYAKKSLGQHFLHDRHAISRIVELLGVETGDQVLEIGPGPGALTTMLRPLPWSRLLLLEKDDHFAMEHNARSQPGLEVRHTDALAFAWAELPGAWKIVGNLPYNIASPLMWDIVSQTPCWQRAVFMIQKEVADRILSAPGTKAYGGLTVWLRSFAVPEKGFTIGTGAFTPPPKVESSVIILNPRPVADLPAHPQALATLIKICFQQRRKQLQGILRKALPERYSPHILLSLGINPARRPETLTEKDFQQLANAFFC